MSDEFMATNVTGKQSGFMSRLRSKKYEHVRFMDILEASVNVQITAA